MSISTVNGQQVTINITDSIIPPNNATIDKDGLVGNAPSKEQLEVWQAGIDEKITQIATSAVKGEATPTSAPTPYDPATYPKGLYEKWEIKTAGTYINFKDSSDQPIVVTSGDLEQKLVYINVTNGVSKKDITAIPGNPMATIYDPNNETDSLSAKITDKMLFGNFDPVVQNKNFGVSSQSSTTNTSVGFVYWISGNVFPEDGTGKTLTIRCFSAGNLYFKVYTDNGSSYIYRDGKTFSVTVGLNTLNLEDFAILKNDVIFLGGVQIYAITGGSEGYTGLLGSNSYVASSTASISKSSLSPSTSTIEFRINYDHTSYEPTGGRVVSEFNNDNIDDLHWPSTKLVKSLIGNNGVRSLTDIILIPSYGQSLSIGQDGGASTFTGPVDIAFTTGNVNSNVQDMNGGYVEMFKEMAKHNNYTLPTGFKIMTCLGGAGGKSISELSKGSTFYNTLISNVQTAKNTADSLGKTFSVPAFCWTQGEEDYRAGGAAANYGTGIYIPTEYANKLSKLIDDLNTDIKAITGQTEDVLCVMYQVASHNTYTRYPRIAIEQLKAAINDKRVVLAKTMYDVEYNTADYVHAPNKTYRNMGNYYGIGLFDAIVNRKHRMPIYPIKSQVVGNVVYVQFHVPVKPLVFDEVWVSPLADGKKGFNLVTVNNEISTSATIAPAATTITNVEIVSADTVKISMSGIPVTGTRLTYGINGLGWDTINGSGTGTRRSGRIEGARGNLRDSQTYFNPVANYFNLYNWCPIFEIVF